MSFEYAIEYENPKSIVQAITLIKGRGNYSFDVVGPYPAEELIDFLKVRETSLPLIALICGALCGSAAFLYQYWSSAAQYALNVGGRPLFSWPAFMPVTFELTVLGASFGIFFGTLFLSGFPELYHPTLNVNNIERASDDRFFLFVKSSDEKSYEIVRSIAESTGGKGVQHVTP